MADCILLSYIVPLQPGDEAHAVSVMIPVNAPGLRLHPRRPYTAEATSVYDYPLSSRFDEIDFIAVFDDVFVPWEHVFIYRDIALTRDQWSHTGAHLLANFQALARFVVKLAFAAGLSRELADHSGIINLPPVQAQLGGQIATTCAALEALLLAAEQQPVVNDHLARPNPQFVYTGMSMQRRLIIDLMRTMRELAGGSVIAVPSSDRAFTSSRTVEDIERYYRGATVEASERIKLLKLYWDFVGTEFAGRQTQYEMFYSAAQHVIDSRVFNTFDWDYGCSLVNRCLESYGLESDSMAIGEHS
jgi:4-hydroxyphenylacetate 3-monooxygenase